MGRPKGSPNRIGGTPGLSRKDPNYIRLVERLEDCADQYERDCDYCPHQESCRQWWGIISMRLENRIMKDADYAVYIAEFEEIRNNGHNEEVSDNIW